MKLRAVLFLTFFTAVAVHAGPRTSASYAITTDIADGGGQRASSLKYKNDGSMGGIAGISTVAAPKETAKHGYVGQLYEFLVAVFDAEPPVANEGGTVQLTPYELLSDSTRLLLPPTAVTWINRSRSIVSISADGLATIGLVYQDTQGLVGVGYANDSLFSLITIRDSIPDNFGAYASDGLSDAWQVQYFGQPPNANAGPLVDADSDGQTNLFEYAAGLVPTDPNSAFRLRLEAVPGQSGQKRVIFSPRFADRTYTVKAKTSLLSVGGWTPINSSVPNDVGQERTITDLGATGGEKFYEVEVVKP